MTTKSFIPKKASFGEDTNSFTWKNLIEALRKAIGGLSFVSSTTTAITTDESQYFVIGDTTSGSVTITLPLASSLKDKQFVIKKKSASNTLTVTANTADTIEGAASVSMTGNYATLQLISDGQNTWYIYSSNAGSASIGALLLE